MFSEAKGMYTPDGMLTLQDVKQAAGFRKERVVLEDAPNPLCGTTKAVNYEYKLRPFREQWLELASHAVPGGLIFAPAPTDCSPKPRKARSRSRTKSPQRTGAPFVVLPEDATLHIQRSRMLHGARTDGDERLAKAAGFAAHESGAINSSGVFRRPVLEAKLNEAATQHLRAIDEEQLNTILPSTPIQVYDFSAKAAYDDVSKLINIDSVTEEIRNIAEKEGTSRQLASQSLHDMWQNNGSFARTISTQRKLIRESTKEGGIVVKADKSRVPPSDVSVISAKPIQRAVDGTVILETDPHVSTSSVGGRGKVSVATGSHVANLASSGYLGTRSQLMNDSPGDGGFADDGGTEFGSIYTPSRPSPDFLSGGFFPPEAGENLLDSDEPVPAFDGNQVAGGTAAPKLRHSSSLTQSLFSRQSRPGSSVFSSGGASLLRPSTQSSSSLLLGASQTLQSSESKQQSSVRKKEILERQLLRISALSGRPVSAAGATSLIAHQTPTDLKQQQDSAAFRYSKPQDRLHLLSKCAQEKREMYGEWKPPATPEFRPKYEPSPKQERQNPFGYLNRVLSSEQRARDQLELKMKSITGLSDAAFESLFAQPEAASERPLTHDHSSAAFTMSFRTGSST